ncbi:MAG: glycosyltransferase family 2 protein [Mycobacteriales bacterium]
MLHEGSARTHLVLLADSGAPAARASLQRLQSLVDGPWVLLSPEPLAGLEVVVGDGDLGERVTRHAADLTGPVVLVDSASAADVTAALTAGSPASGPGWLRVEATDLLRPVVSAARSFAALQALTTVASRPLRRLSHGPHTLLSASLIVKDEQAALPTCLASLDGQVDEIVVCDTGSSDRTIEIAEAFGARIVHAPWTHDFAAARNVPLAACRGAWVLSIDADEQLVASRASELRRALTPRGVPAYGVLIKSLTDDASQGVGFEHEAIRLFRRQVLCWVGAVHETVAHQLTGIPPEARRFAGIHLDHDGYLGTVYRERDKAARNLLLAEKDYAAARDGALGRSVSKTAYELSRALSLTPGTEERQEALLREALDQMPQGMGRLASSAALRLAGLLRRNGVPLEAATWAAKAVDRSPSDPTAAWELAEALRALDRPSESLEVLDRWERQPLRANEAVSRTAAVADLSIPLSRTQSLVALDRRADAANVLATCARQQGQAFEHWPMLAELLQTTRATWAADLAALCPTEAFGFLASLDVLSPDDRRDLMAALRARGIEPAEYAAETGFRSALAEALVDHDPAAVAAAALALEAEQPHLALQAWLQLAPDGRRQVAIARCHLALNDLDGAFAALDDLDVDSLSPPDLLTVALLAAHAGDATTAWSLLDSLPADLSPEVSEQAALLHSALPSRVVLT